MNDIEFQEWSEELANLRKARRDWVSSQIKQKKASFTCAEFFQEMVRTLGDIIDRWWNKEQASEQRTHTPYDRNEVDRLKNEVDGLIQFEVGAIEDDLAYALGQIPWDSVEIDPEREELTKFSDQLKSSYDIKIGAPISKKEPETTKGFDPFPAEQNAPLSRSASGGITSASGASLVGMFLVGLFLGSIFSFFVWKSSKTAEEQLQDELSQIKSKYKTLEDRVSMYQKNYLLLAEGKLQSVPGLENEINSIHERFAAKRKSAKKRSDRDALANREKQEIAPLIEQLEALKKAIQPH